MVDMGPVEIVLLFSVLALISGISGIVLFVRGNRRNKAGLVTGGTVLVLISISIIWFVYELLHANWKVGG
jgi:uncharacterized membrane protein YqjE